MSLDHTPPATSGLPGLPRIAIVGAGAIGGWLGAKLGALGCPVSVLARGATLAALRQHGLRLQTAQGQISVPVQADSDAAALGVQDVVLIAVKAPALAQVAQQAAALIGPQTLVVTAMNGVPWWFLQGLGARWAAQAIPCTDPDGSIARALPQAKVLGCVVHASCAVQAPGLVRHHFGDGLILGEPAGGLTPRLQALVALLQRAGFAASASELIQRDIWFKLWGNITMNPVSALTGATADRILDDALVRGFINRVMLEAQAIGAAIGLPIAQQPDDRHAVTRKLGAFKTSMLQDVEAGKPIELDALVGAVRELGQLSGTPTPYTDALLGLARLRAQVLGLYPDMAR